MKEKIGVLEQEGLRGWRWESMVEREYRKGLENYDLAREELGQVSTAMHGFHLIEFSLYPKKKVVGREQLQISLCLCFNARENNCCEKMY